jgi:hypothetical protein
VRYFDGIVTASHIDDAFSIITNITSAVTSHSTEECPVKSSDSYSYSDVIVSEAVCHTITTAE